MKSNLFRPACRALIVGLSSVWVLLSAAPAWAAADPDGYTERLVIEFTPLIGSREDTETLVTQLRNGVPASGADAANAAAAAAPLSYGETRFALKLAQGALAQDGVLQPSNAQLQAALYGGTLNTVDGPKALPGVLPQHAQGVSWGSMAQNAGMSVEDLIPPRAAMQKKTAARKSSKAKKSGKKTSKAGSKKSSTATKTTKATKNSAAKHAGKAGSQKGKAKPQKKVVKR